MSTTSPQAVGEPIRVTIDSNFNFNPDPVSVPVGGSVIWVNTDTMIHTATADNGSFDTGNIPGGASSQPIKFNAAGSVPYHCTPHPFMTGTVIVT
jgi:plastocyanin